jgi:3-hydroxy acid dehydrogenase / malonic semialdehyde reductase
MNRIKNKLALITGASAGIGEATARRFASDGCNLALWARRADKLAELANALRKEHGVQVSTDIVDVRDRAAVNDAAQRMVQDVGIPHILVNSAGLASGMANLQDGDPDDWDLMLDTNVKGLLLVTRAVLPRMIAEGRGHIVNMGSAAGHMTYPKGNVYNASKYAVRALNEAMSLDLLGTPIRVSSVDPGLVETEFSVVRFHGDRERAKTPYKGLQPLVADDIADVIGYIVNTPEHVNILDVLIYPTAQRNVYTVHRDEPGK